ncbi:MAG TPA: serine hydrolase domain-containing protein, partial [Chloroflexota bacterium]|nr:serine hydrolase domain-containing protein [Chloroflexota bacterium]
MDHAYRPAGQEAHAGTAARAGRAASPQYALWRICLGALLTVASTVPWMVSGTPGAYAATVGTADRRLSAALDADFRTTAREHDFSGAVLVAQRGAVLLQRGYGMADWERGVPNTDDTEFRISALSGQFTAAAVLQLQEHGVLHIRDRLCLYLRGACPRAWAAITIQQLLNGSSGLHDYANDPRTANLLGSPITPAQLIALIGGFPLDATPGTQCGFYNGSYPVLGYLVSRVSGQPFATYIRRHFLAPLDLRHTGFDQDRQSPNQAATGYLTWQLRAAPDVDLSFVAAASGMYSTVADLYRWQQALEAGRVLAPAMVAAMVTPTCAYCQAAARCSAPPGQSASTSGPVGVVPGWAALDDSAGPGGAGYPWEIGIEDHRRYWGLTATLPGFVSFERSFPNQQVTVIMLGNQRDAALDLLSFELANRLFGQ